MPSLAARDLDVEPLLDDVDDLVDHQPHRAAVVGEHQDRLRRRRCWTLTPAICTSGIS